MENFNLASLPLAILHLILSKVATNSVSDFGSARVAFREFNEIGRHDYFYRAANLLFMNHWFNESAAVRRFLHRCYNAGNPEAIYLRGMYDFFRLHLVDEGWQKIRLAGERGCSLAKYVDGMMSLAFSVDARGLVHKYPAFTRDHVGRMSHLIAKLGANWVYDKPGMFLSVSERIDPNAAYRCWCSRIEEPLFVVSIDGSTSHWKCNRCFWQAEAWNFCETIHLTVRGWPIED